MDLESIIRKILEQRKDLTRKEVLDLIEVKKKEAHDLLSDEGAARLVAQDLLVKIEGRTFGEIKIVNLVTSLNDVTLTGRVVAQWPLQEFQKQDGTSGKLVRLIIADKTGTLRCALWNSKAEQTAAAGDLQGRIVRIAHGYTRESWLGTPELNGGDRCEITILPPDSKNQDYPDISEFFKEIRNVKLTDKEVSVVGVVDSPPRISTFTKGEEEGTVLRATIADGTGTINVVAWNDKVQDLTNLEKGNILRIINGRVKADLAGTPEVHLGSGSVASILRERPPYLKVASSGRRQISSLKPQSKGLAMLVRVLKVGEVREFTRTDGGMSRYGTLLVGDETGLIRLFLWDDQVKPMSTIREGDILLVEDAQAREKGGEVFVSVSNSGRLTFNPELSDADAPKHPSQVMLGDLNDFSRPVIVEGVLVADADLRSVQIGSGESIEVATVILNDGTGRARLSLWRELAEKAGNLKAGMKIKVTGIQPRSKFSDEVVMSSSSLTELKVTGDRNQRPDEGKLISDYI